MSLLIPDLGGFMAFGGDYCGFWVFFMLIYPSYLFFSIFSPTSSIGRLEFFHKGIENFCEGLRIFYAKLFRRSMDRIFLRKDGFQRQIAMSVLFLY